MSGTETIKTFDAGLKSGTTLQSGKYTILKTLGQGGFGITYLAEMRVGSGNMTIKIAIKEFFIKLEHFRGDNGCTVCCTNNELKKDEIERWKKKFKRETKVMKSVDDFRVVKIIDYFEENATAYYSMEYIEGCNLNEYVPINGLSEMDSLLLIEKVAQSLKVLHNKNILHLDLNPMNIMRRNDGSVVIIDFGLSKLYDEDLNLKSTSITIGAEFPGYAPLEQEDFDGTFTPTLDIYALGANLFKMLTGGNPPMSRKLVYDFSSLRKKMTAKGIGSDTIGIVEKAMQINPTERYRNVDEFLQALPVETDLTEVTVYDNDIDDVTEQYDKTQRAENVAIDENGNRYSIESIDGCTLDDYIKQQRKISEIQAITYIKAVAKALKYLHKINMAHLDLNPRNIMCSKDGKLFLMKIGLSKQNDDNGNAVSATSVSISVFSKGYAPQEQYWKSFDGIFTPTLDIYALGAIFYKMLTGETPPESNIIWDFSSLRRKLSVHGISAYTIAVVEKAMQLDKKNRYQSVDAFIVALSKLEEDTKRAEVVNILESLKNEKLSDETQRRVDTVPKKTVAEPKVIQFDATRRVEKKDTNPKQEVVKEVETVNEQPQKMFAHPFSFKGRIRRLEYNLSVLIVVAVALLGSYIAYHSDYDNIICIVSIVLCGMFIIPQGAKRCHDLGNSGWWQLTLIYILVMMFDYSDEGGNKYGECPKKHKEHYDPIYYKDSTLRRVFSIIYYVSIVPPMAVAIVLASCSQTDYDLKKMIIIFGGWYVCLCLLSFIKGNTVARRILGLLCGIGLSFFFIDRLLSVNYFSWWALYFVFICLIDIIHAVYFFLLYTNMQVSNVHKIIFTILGISMGLILYCSMQNYKIAEQKEEQKRITRDSLATVRKIQEQREKDSIANINRILSDFVLIPSGTLMYNGEINMDEYYICKYETTQKEFENIMNYNPSDNGNDSFRGYSSPGNFGASKPVNLLTFREMVEYCNKKSLKENFKGFYKISEHDITIDLDGNGYRLPSEYEWIFAARSGEESTTKFAASSNLNEDAWYGPNSRGHLHDVGLKQPNARGLFDMNGNVGECVWDKGSRPNENYAIIMGSSFESYYEPSFKEGAGWCLFCNEKEYWCKAPMWGFRVVLILPNMSNHNCEKLVFNLK